MSDWFIGLEHTTQALLATLFTWGVTALGAGLVFFFRSVNQNITGVMLAFAGGVMIAASFWSLLSPSIEMAENMGMTSWLIAFAGFFSGGLLLYVVDKAFNRLSRSRIIWGHEKKEQCIRRSMLLLFSITLHNIPEGLAIGVAFGSLAYGLEGATLTMACLLALGIGIQNFPEGTAVSVPLRNEGFTRRKAFFFGQLSAVVEPMAAVLGAVMVLKARILLPYLLAFAAGAMIYVVVRELVPESQSGNRREFMAIFVLVGFSIMMILDTALTFS